MSLEHCLQHHGILYYVQSRFRPKHSTQTVDDWWLSLSKNEVVEAMLVDLSKASDLELLLLKTGIGSGHSCTLEWF